MSWSRIAFRSAFVVLMLTTLSGCLRVQNTRGNFVEDQKWAAIKVGMSQAEVAQTLGTPTTLAMFQDNAWLYVGIKESHIAFMSPRVDATRIGKIVFDENGRVKSVSMEEPSSWHQVNVSNNKTPDLSHRRTIVRRIFGNVGRFVKKDEPVKPRVGGSGASIPTM